MNKKDLRSKYRKIRNKISEAEQLLAAHEISNNLFKIPKINNAKHIAGYWPNDNEISPIPFLEQAMRQNKNCYLPLLIGNDSLMLDFAAYTKDSNLLKNSLGIPEPENNKLTPITQLQELDIILLPLVAFDLKGTRLGMGAGYYDATLSKLIDVEPIQRPLIVGLAHSCQQAEDLPVDEWDWSLNIVVTDKEIFHINSPHNHATS